MATALTVAHIEMGQHLYGGAQQVLYLLDGLADVDIASVLVCPQGSAIAEAARAQGSRVIEMPYSGDLDWRAIGRLRALFRAHAVDLVHIHSRRGADIWGALAARREGLPCVLSRRVDNRESRWAVALKYPLYDAVITISEGIKRVLLECGVPEAKITCVRSAVDFARFQQPADRERLRQRFDLPSDARVVAIAAQLIERKGHQVLLAALPDLIVRWPSLHVLVLGQGPLRASLDQQIDAMGLAAHVHMVGFVKDLETVLPSVEALVHPALIEGLGVVLLQAASAGVPVIASRAGGMPEAVVDAQTGWLVEPGDVAGLQRALVALLEAPDQAKAYGRAGRDRMQREFSIEQMVAGNAQVYRALTSQ